MSHSVWFKRLVKLRRLSHSKKWFTAMLTVIALITMAAASYVNHIVQEQQRSQIYNETQQWLSRYHSRLVTSLQNHIQIIRGLPGLFIVNPDLTQDEFSLAMQHLFHGQNQLRNIAAAPDMVIRYTYPLAGNRATLGLDYRKVPDQFAAAELARTTGRLVLAGPLELKQGGVGLITRIPVFRTQNEKREFWGLISAVIDSNAFFAAAGLDNNMPIELAIRGKDGLGANGEMVWGEPALFDDPRMLMRMELPEGYWQLVAQPLGGWQAAQQNVWQTRILIFGIAIAIFILLEAFFRLIFSASLANLKFRHLIENSPIPYLLVSSKKQVSFINPAFTESYGYRLDNFPQLMAWWQQTSLDPGYQKQLNLWLEGKLAVSELSKTTTEVTITCPDGSERVALLSFSALQDAFENELLLVFYDITVRKTAEQQLRFAAQMFTQAHEGIVITETDGTIIDVNPAFTSITGYPREEVIGQNPSLLKSGRHDDGFYAAMWQALDKDGYWRGEVWNKRRDGELYAQLMTISALAGKDAQERHYVGLFSDITQTKQQQETLELMAHYDVLTKLPNRVLFAERFQQATEHSRKTQTWLGVCFLDLDNFKPVNDTYGHSVGDKLLVEVAKRLTDCVREGDTLSRFGGDEFAILFQDVESYEQCELFLQRIHETLAQPFKIGDLELSLSASSGIAMYPQDDDNLDTLLRYSDQAMYQAKLTGRNTYQLFNPHENQQTIEKHALLQALRVALQEDQLCLYFQPEINMRNGKVMGVEALIRWQHPEQGLLLPGQFLPVLADTELEIQVGNWVIQQAIRQIDAFQNVLKQPLFISVNIAASHLQSRDFVSNLQAALAAYPQVLSPSLQLEILETGALGDVRTISRVIRDCREQLGVQVALDDFGTGYSSLTHLRHLSANTIKIDQSFVRDLLDDPNDFNIVEGVIGLARAFDRQVVAEGVESEAIGQMLLLLNCDLAQGYAIAKPMPAADFIDWIAHYQPLPGWQQLAEKNLSPWQKSLYLLRLSVTRWLGQFSAEHKDSPIPSTALNPQTSHCGSLLRRCSQQQAANMTCLQQLATSQDYMHEIARALNACEATSPDRLELQQQLAQQADIFYALIDRALAD
ncbi:diguanylate cyclase/phosphodiesterase (GGDEF & EAL domains) with PAS/PAC sensor(s) [Methylophaga frappieri]|uniref:Diguanylate cyclase/phosphodiesterase (GGDEF & EAL domains) with PAS/PAC sensor(S) n=1 Tax=Methylophaga frappieri (strain ATCC BAA-2434 / DSM 25690 / JAM7) TaxID=754477 RepID=I1YJV0_METFJ|nr:EAL domain-containing protein [Methylophaga frappieri]AFJ03193.1 diguanylate cyclase/phosphodiesterase (GGDEF & EAL domains) with PAS/PAC sensor(s) [Methylophaga frappieri]